MGKISTKNYEATHYDVLNVLRSNRGDVVTYGADDEVVQRLIMDGLASKVEERSERVVDVVLTDAGHALLERTRGQ